MIVALPLLSGAVLVNGGSAVVEVLHVSTCTEDEVQEVLNRAGATALFDVTQVSIFDFNAGQPSDLSQYDVVAFGLNDCYECHYTITQRTSDLRQYVEQGGGIVWTHDSLEHAKDLGPEAEEPAGVNYTPPGGAEFMYEIEVVADHQMVHEPFEIGGVGDTFSVQETHTTGGEVTTADVILDFPQWNGGAKNFYLTAHEWANGRVAVDELGHKVFSCKCNFISWPSALESRIFANALWWAGGGVQNPGAKLDIDPDTLNLKSKGTWVTGYLTFENATPEDIDMSSLLLMESLSPESWDIQGETLMLKFSRQELQSLLDVGESVEISLSGKLKDDREFRVSDHIRVTNP